MVPSPSVSPSCPAATLPSGLRVSRIGLGLADVHRMVPGAADRLIGAALDLGITHVDTAAFYGDGLSERILGRALRAHGRGRFTVTTKFGLLPTPWVPALGPLAPLGRKARGALRRTGLVPYPRRSYSVATLHRSLVRSLRALGTDRVDVLAIHEPDGSAGITDELVEALVAVRRAGQARLVGVAGDDVAAVLARWGDALDVVQTAETGGRTGDRVPDFTYRLFSDAPAPLAPAEADGRLRAALRRRPHGAVLVQTRSPARLERCVAIAGEAGGG
jgi:aryl-alcohol dehydrogenase-like predicted oxidoreductase